MKIAIIDYGAGNIQSIEFALERLGYRAVFTKDEAEIRQADKVIFPGVGEASSAMDKLQSTGLDKVIPRLTQPVLGICLGMQLMCGENEEGPTQGLSIFDAPVLRFPNSVKVPQIGWNQITDLDSPLFDGIDPDSYVYLVHSFYIPESAYAISSSQYGLSYTTALRKDNFYGVQFHPEKSSKTGAQILLNFLTKCE
ncbi:imidazole glycerol phosphate synthase subunit HisH [Aureitalea marina]|uniref:Imidazole glycerol phosphate synthase subunit HisH n=1 Tax=Aureitalea marina TaxID=930804 RepID=A0A2S7KPA3_9FLAO|nr:imidazole glycerol phosphate synthase subunit HisH [Aureitalea marina]PQB04437.1 imidazole glycerol phosphate synthase subunit HisH [Aureitalea marina]